MITDTGMSILRIYKKQLRNKLPNQYLHQGPHYIYRQIFQGFLMSGFPTYFLSVNMVVSY